MGQLTGNVYKKNPLWCGHNGEFVNRITDTAITLRLCRTQALTPQTYREIILAVNKYFCQVSAMKLRILLLAAFLAVPAFGQNNSGVIYSNGAVYSNGVLISAPAVTVVATSATGTSNTVALSKDTAAVTAGGAVLKAGATQDSAVHSNFSIGAAWLVIVVPLVITALKMLVPKIPSSWLPVIAPLLGTLGDGLTSYFTGNAPNPALGALYGAAGVGIREVIDQIKQAAMAKAQGLPAPTAGSQANAVQGQISPPPATPQPSVKPPTT